MTVLRDLAVVGAACVLVGSLLPNVLQAQVPEDDQEPQLLRLKLNRTALLLEYEERTRRTDYADTRRDTRTSTQALEPGVELGMAGSVYHPYLLDFSLNGVLAYREEEYDYDGVTRRGRSTSGTDSSFLQRYNATATLLKSKPYAVTLSGYRSEYDRDLDFFEREQVVSDRYEVRSGYRVQENEFGASYSRWSEDVSGERTADRQEDVVSLTAARRKSRYEVSEIDYTLRDLLYRRDENAIQDGQIQEVRLRDIRLIDGNEDRRLNSDLRFNTQDTSAIATQRAHWREILRVEHNEQLRSHYSYRLSDRRAGSANSQSHIAQARVKHHLYESLVSGAELEFQTTGEKSDDSNSRFTRFGGGVNEAYTKRLPAASRVSFGGSWNAYINEARNDGATVTVLDETLTLSDESPSTLLRPLVDRGSIVITDRSGAIPYLEGLDYRVIPRGAFTEIQRIIGGNIPRNSTVLVDYRAGNQPSNRFQSTEARAYFRLSLFSDYLAFYSQLDDIRSYGDATAIRQDYQRFTLGAEAGPRWSKTGIEYEDNQSSSFPYVSTRVFERLNLALPRTSSFSLDLSRQWRDYPGFEETETYEYAIATLRTQLLSNLLANVAAGNLREARGAEQRDRTTVRAGIEYRYGNLTVSTHYEYEDDTLSQREREDETRNKHRLWIRTRRLF